MRVMARMLSLALAVVLAVSWSAVARAQGDYPVDLELILMADGSGSVDYEEFLLQRQGYARALREPRVVNAIRSGALGRIALTYVEWSGHSLQVPIVDWTVVSSAAEVEAFAQQLEKQPRSLEGGGTAVGSAILYGVESLNNNLYKGTRRVIDLSGDGPDKDGVAAAYGRDHAVAQGITVNGLPILSPQRPRLDLFFIDNVIGGPGAFSIPAKGFKDFYSAILTKLIREIAGRPVDPAHRAVARGPVGTDAGSIP